MRKRGTDSSSSKYGSSGFFLKQKQIYFSNKEGNLLYWICKMNSLWFRGKKSKWFWNYESIYERRMSIMIWVVAMMISIKLRFYGLEDNWLTKKSKIPHLKKSV